MTGLRRLVSQSAILFAVRLAGSGVAFATQALIARFYSPAVLGDYMLALAAINVAATVMPLGFQVVGGYFAAEYRATGSRRALMAYLRQAAIQIAVVAALLTGAGSIVIATVDMPSVLRPLWAPGVVMAVAAAAIYLNGALLVGLKQPFAGLLPDILLRSLLTLGAFGVVIAMASDQPLTPLFRIVALGYAAIACVQTLLMLRTLRGMPDDAPAQMPSALRRKWMRYALPWAVVTLATDFFFDIDLLLLGRVLPSDDLAVIGICARICGLLAFGIGTIYTVTMPDILAAGARADESDFRRRIEDANVLATAAAAALAAAMFASGPALGLLFGPRFAAAHLPLGIMASGLVIRAAMGPSSLILSFHDRPAASVPSALIGLLTLIVANALLAPSFGVTGAAFASVIAITAWSLALWLTVRRKLNADVSILPRVKALFAPTASA